MDENELEERANKMIDEKDCQTTFNKDTIDELIGEGSKIENVISN